MAAAAAGQEHVGVLLLNLGGPDTLEDVQPFLYNLFADPDIIRLPAAVQFLQPLIAQLISSLRAPKSREGYEAIGGGSPLRRITEEQASALAASLRRKGINASTYVAMRYWFPFTGGCGVWVGGLARWLGGWRDVCRVCLALIANQSASQSIIQPGSH